VSVKSILGWAALAFVVFWVIEKPTGATHFVRNIGTFLSTGASDISSFLASI